MVDAGHIIDALCCFIDKVQRLIVEDRALLVFDGHDDRVGGGHNGSRPG